MSTASRSADGISEKERRELQAIEVIPAGKYKKRHLKQLDANERTSIIYSSLIDHNSNKDIACRYRISAALVSRLISSLKKNPTMLTKLR